MKNKSYWIVASILFLILCGVVCFNKHQDYLYVKKAHKCFKNNNIACTQSYLEKAFQLGVKTSADRELYLNTIITAPLDLKAQEKLFNFLNLGVDDSVNFRAECFVHDLRREINNKYSGNYIMQAVLNQKIVRWAKPTITYNFMMPKEEDFPEYYKEEIENAFLDWAKAMDFEFSFAENAKNPNITIRFDYHNPADDDKLKYVVAYTSPTTLNNELKKMTILFYVKDPHGKFYTKNQVYNTALHELAHALGVMGHSNNKENVMYLTKDEHGVFDVAKSVLSEADINTMKLLYKVKPDITNLDDNKSEYLPFLVLGDSEDVINAKLREAKLYIKRAPHLPNGYIDLAEAYVGQKDYLNATKILEKALRIAETDEIREMIFYNLAICNYYSESYILAEDYIKRAIEIKNSENSNFILAMIYVQTEQLADAEKIFVKLLQENPKSLDYMVNLVNLYLKEKKIFKARKILKNFMQNNPDERFNPLLDNYGILKIGL